MNKSSVILFALLLPLAVLADVKKPNILFIIADDQSPFDFKSYNPSSPLDAPAIGKLAAEGMTFDQAYHMGSMSGAVCSPSRRMIMTGRTVWHLQGTGGRRNTKKEVKSGITNPIENCLPAIFNAAGYDTMRTCKNGNSHNGANAQFTVRHDAGKRGGTHETGSGWHGDRVMDYLDDRQKPRILILSLSILVSPIHTIPGMERLNYSRNTGR